MLVVVDKLIFSCISVILDTFLPISYVFWIGDLNFRLDEVRHEKVLQSVASGDIEYLKQFDQVSTRSQAGFPLHRENGQKYSLSGKTHGFWKFSQKKPQNLICSCCKFPESKGKRLFDVCRENFQTLDKCQVSVVYVIVTNHVNWQRENLLSDREKTGNLKMQFEWVTFKGSCTQEKHEHNKYISKKRFPPRDYIFLKDFFFFLVILFQMSLFVMSL